MEPTFGKGNGLIRGFHKIMQFLLVLWDVLGVRLNGTLFVGLGAKMHKSCSQRPVGSMLMFKSMAGGLESSIFLQFLQRLSMQA